MLYLLPCFSILNSSVSMVDGDLFDKLSMIGSKLRKNLAPFGGIQVISSSLLYVCADPNLS
jgi:ATP-dependent DNA helicase PIF1